MPKGQIDAVDDPDLLAALFINCWQGTMIRIKGDAAASECLRFALDRVLGMSRSEGFNEVITDFGGESATSTEAKPDHQPFVQRPHTLPRV